MSVRYHLVLILVLFDVAAGSARAQDTRSVSEPIFPATCVTLNAPLHSRPSYRPVIGQTAGEQGADPAAETAMLNDAQLLCAPGQAIELALGRDPSENAFLIEPVTLKPGVSLIIDGGVTVYASRDPQRYQDPTTPTITCGDVGAYPVNQGCKPLLTLAASSGVYGYGVLDGQGNKELIAGDNAGTT